MGFASGAVEATMAPSVFVLFVMGLIIGSFLGVVVDRVPKGLSVVHPPSTCPRCGTRLGPFDLIPVLSYLLQRGACRYCNAKIPVRDLAIEVAAGLSFAGVYAVTSDWQATVSGVVFAAFLIVMFLIDLSHLRLPNSINAFGVVAGVLLAAAGWSDTSFTHALAGALAGGGVVLLVSWLSKGGMGVGDAKFLAAIGAFLGPIGALYTLFAGSFVGAGVGLVLIKLGRHERGGRIPFGPFLALGAVLVWVTAKI